MAHRDALFEIMAEWAPDQVEEYIHKLQARVAETQILIRELRALNRRKKRMPAYDNGVRGGK